MDLNATSKDSHSASVGWMTCNATFQVCSKRICAVQQPSSLVLKMLECPLMPGGWWNRLEQ